MAAGGRGIVLSVVFLLALLGGIVAYVAATAVLKIPGPLDEPKLVYIAPNSGSRAIAQQLDAEGVIDHPYLFLAGAAISKTNGGRLMAGEYQFPRKASINDIIALLQSGKTYQHQLTVPEGLTVAEIIGLLNAETALKGDAINVFPPEGSLLPETYNYSYGDTRQSVLTRMQSAMSAELDKLWAAKGATAPVSTKEQLVTLASIVEKETGLPAERPRVAGVFANRLKIGMPLQSDPTVIYAVTQGKSKLERPIYRKDLELQSPYNTYLNPGLPPGPIANPGRASLEAVMNPEQNNFLFFVADGTGGHVFASNLDEHNRNVTAWRAIERKAKTDGAAP